VELVESGKGSKNDKCRLSTTPENRMPICAIGRAASYQLLHPEAKQSVRVPDAVQRLFALLRRAGTHD